MNINRRNFITTTILAIPTLAMGISPLQLPKSKIPDVIDANYIWYNVIPKLPSLETNHIYLTYSYIVSNIPNRIWYQRYDLNSVKNKETLVKIEKQSCVKFVRWDDIHWLNKNWEKNNSKTQILHFYKDYINESLIYPESPNSINRYMIEDWA